MAGSSQIFLLSNQTHFNIRKIMVEVLSITPWQACTAQLAITDRARSCNETIGCLVWFLNQINLGDREIDSIKIGDLGSLKEHWKWREDLVGWNTNKIDNNFCIFIGLEKQLQAWFYAEIRCLSVVEYICILYYLSEILRNF